MEKQNFNFFSLGDEHSKILHLNVAGNAIDVMVDEYLGSRYEATAMQLNEQVNNLRVQYPDASDNELLAVVALTNAYNAKNKRFFETLNRSLYYLFAE
ncbi:MAG: hypothetical protein ACI308_01180 [Muribaculaceae bacterium]